MSDTKFEALEGRGAKLVGTFSPGQHQLAFRFQVPRGGSDAAAFKVGVPRRVVEMRVIAEANANMHLEVDGFEPTQPDVAQTGTRVLVTRKLIQREDEEIGTFSAVLSGLPTPGLGRWIAVAIATLLAGAGLAAARGTFDRSIDATSGNEEDRRHARDLILDQLVALERARKTEEVGPRAYERAHQELLDALARLGVEADPAPRKKAKRGASKHPSEASTG